MPIFINIDRSGTFFSSMRFENPFNNSSSVSGTSESESDSYSASTNSDDDDETTQSIPINPSILTPAEQDHIRKLATERASIQQLLFSQLSAASENTTRNILYVELERFKKNKHYKAETFARNSTDKIMKYSGLWPVCLSNGVTLW